MRSTPIALGGIAAALLLGMIGAASAQSSAPGTQMAPSATTTPNTENARSIDPSLGQAQNPMVNPSAAGTQQRWTGYEPSSGATGDGVRGPDASMPPAGRPTDESTARQRLRQLGYSRITDIRRLPHDGWLARARWGHREVTVRLDGKGDVVGQR